MRKNEDIVQNLITIISNNIETILVLLICGYLPGFFFLAGAWRIYRKQEITLTSPDHSFQSWRKPVTHRKRGLLYHIISYVALGLLCICIATTILISMILK
jgi:hypothetical protein